MHPQCKVVEAYFSLITVALVHASAFVTGRIRANIVGLDSQVRTYYFHSLWMERVESCSNG